MHPLTERQIAALHTGAYLLPADPACPTESFPVMAAAGLRIGLQIREDGSFHLGVDSEDADASLRGPDGRLRGVEVHIPRGTRVRRQPLRRAGSPWRRLVRRGVTRPSTSRLFRMNGGALEQLIADAHSELHRRAVLALAEFLPVACAERGWAQPVEVRCSSSYDDYESRNKWSPNGVEFVFADGSRRSADFGRREWGESLATEMVRAYLSEATEHQEPPFDSTLVVTLRPSPAFHIDRDHA
ncbi:hypothetical protein [Kitasatospora griseola]|uniref:hypothetical protein n=1 Tax=Kitasatospora griseola TaxID=2064 RepID=UPI003439EB87